MNVSLDELTRLVNGQLVGDPAVQVQGAATAETASKTDITLAEEAKFVDSVLKSGAPAVVVPLGLQVQGLHCIMVEDVHQAFTKIVSRFRPPRPQPSVGVSPAAEISPTARLGQRVAIHPGAMIGDEVLIGDDTTIYPGVCILAGCRIGSGVTVFPNAVLYENTVIGNRCIIHAGAVIGAYGFGYKTVQGKHQLSAQLGNVEIGDEVEIGACTTIDRGTYGPTVIGEGTKIDNQVMIAHNCIIGRHNLLCSHVGIAGSCTTGDFVVMAGQVGIGDHIHIGNQVVLGAKAGVMNDIPDGQSYVGIPATPVREQMVKQVAFAKLPELRKMIKQLQRDVEELSCQGDGEELPRNEAA